MACSSNYVKGECIGRGSFGEVFRGVESSSGRECALKLVDLEVVTDEIEVIQREIKVMSQISNQDVVQYYTSFMEGSTLWIVMEYLAGGSLKELIDSVGPLSEEAIAAIMRSLMRGLDYVHKGGKVHRDIKAANILLSAGGDVKLADFGVAGQMTATIRQRNTFVGTPVYMAPEVIEESAYNERADIWSIGITAIELATGLPPHASEHQLRALFIIPKSDPPRLEGDFSKSFKSFVDACLRKNPADRASAEELKGHPFIKKARSSAIRDAMKRKRVQEEVTRLSMGPGGGRNGIMSGDRVSTEGNAAASGLEGTVSSVQLSVDSSMASSAIGGTGVGIGGATVGACPRGNKPSTWEFDSVDGIGNESSGALHHRSPSRHLADIPDDLGTVSEATGSDLTTTGTRPAIVQVSTTEALAPGSSRGGGDSDATLSPIEVDVDSITVTPASRTAAISAAPHPEPTRLPTPSSSSSLQELDNDLPTELPSKAPVNGSRPTIPPHLPTPPAPPAEANAPSTVLSDLVLPIISDMRADIATTDGGGGEERGLLTALGSLEVAFVDTESARPGITATLVECLIKEALGSKSRELRAILMRALHHHETSEKNS